MTSNASIVAVLLLGLCTAIQPVGCGTSPDDGVELKGKMYWVNSTGGQIQRADLDGSNVEVLVRTGHIMPMGIALDPAAGKVYWAGIGELGITPSKIQCADLDGSNVEDLVTTGFLPAGIALDVAGGKVYWTNEIVIARANLDGSDREPVITVERTASLALDVANGKVYWIDFGIGKIQRANLDGTEVEDVIATINNTPQAIFVDSAGGKLYWTIPRPTLIAPSSIRRANLDGTEEEIVISGAGTPRGIAVAGGKIYWTSYEDVKRANLDGSNVETVVDLEYPENSLQGIALDVTGDN